MNFTESEVQQMMEQAGVKVPMPPAPKPRIEEHSKLVALFLGQLRLVAPDLPPMEAEIVFAPPRKWRIDFGYARWRIAIELEGYDHRLPERYASDLEKYFFLSLGGWILIRVTWGMLQADPERCFGWIRLAIAAREGQAGQS